MKFFYLINYNSLIICIFLLLSSLFLFSYLYKSKILITGSLLIFIFFALFFTFNKITQHNSSKYDYINNEIKNGDWLILPVPENPESIFSTNDDEKWDIYSSLVGINLDDLSGKPGQA